MANKGFVPQGERDDRSRKGSRVFTSRYDGDCSDCGFAYDEGDEIFYNTDDEIVAVECCGKNYR